MRHLKLTVILLIFLLSGCIPKIETILNKMNAENTSYIYIYTAPSIQSEMTHQQKVLADLDSTKNTELFRLLDDLRNRTTEISGLLRNPSGGEKMVAVKKPPRPCPTGSCFEETEFISFFTINPEDNIRININNTEIPVRNFAYDKLTQIKTVRIPGKIAFQASDVVNLKLAVSYLDINNHIKRDELDWKIQNSR